MKKVCSKCGEEKELDCFYFRKDINKFRNNCKVCHQKKLKEYRQNNKEYLKKYNKKYYYENKINILKQHKEYWYNNKKWLNEKKREYYLKNKYKIEKYKNSYYKEKKQNEPLYRISCQVRSNIYKIIMQGGYYKKSKTEKILGCSFEKFKQHLESQFQKGMTWDNYGRNGWHIDHIYPVSKARDEEHLLELNHYTNLQPLWEKDNIAKGNRLDWSE